MKQFAVYGLRLKTDKVVRYVGLSKNPAMRFSQHRSKAVRNTSFLPVHCWMRKYGVDAVEMVLLEECGQDEDYLYYAEKHWIASFTERGKPLLNLTLGGDGVRGIVPWNKGIPLSEEQKETLRQANIGKKHTDTHKRLISQGVAAHFQKNGHRPVVDFWIEKYGEEEATKLREAKRQKASASLSGEGNPMFGRSGQEAPCYGRLGEKHPMFGKAHSEDAKRKISEATKGRKKSEVTKLKMSFAQHIRSHAETNNQHCRWCLGANLQDEIQKKEAELRDERSRTSTTG